LNQRYGLVIRRQTARQTKPTAKKKKREGEEGFFHFEKVLIVGLDVKETESKCREKQLERRPTAM
jgi:hypothetical protein